jgi:TonB-dependent starch-binding outer membrane protein SusC
MPLPRYVIGGLPTLLCAAVLSAQETTGTIQGRVTDAVTQQPLWGATVSLGSHRAVSLSDGRYLLSGVPVGTDSLRVRVIGFAAATRSVTIGAGETVTLDFPLTQQAVGLSEVVVTGYGEQRAGNLTGAGTKVSAEDFNPGRNISPQQLIADKVAGVQVVDNNEPGGGLSVRVRGQASVNAGSEPLYVVDGVPLGTGSGGGLNTGRDPLNFLNPNDIESITVLKDAAASAIYGANASNGVVLITTKPGSGRPRVEYSGSVSASSVTRLPAMLNAAQFRTAVQQQAAQFDTLLLNSNTNWFDLVDRTAIGQEHNVALSGAGTTNGYRLSLGYLNQDGILQGTTAERLTLGVGYDQRLYGDRLDLRVNLKGSRANDRFTPNGVLYNAGQMGPTQPVFDATSTTGYYNWPGNSLTSADNPVEVLSLSADHATTYRSIGNVQAKYDFSAIQALRGLTGTVNLGYDVTTADRVSFYPNDIHYETKIPTKGSYYRTTPNQANTVLDAYLTYTPPSNIGSGTLDVTAGYSYSQSHFDSAGTLVTQFTSNALGDNGIPSTGLVAPNLPDVQESKLISFFGRVGYNIGDRYLASASLRRDGSSRFGASNQWGYFPAVSVGWRISREPFMSSIPAISDLKLRASWGKTGNQAFANYLQHVTFQPCNAQAQVQLGNQFVCPARPSAVDLNIKWESTASWDVGADYGLFDQRLSGSLDWYTKRTDDLIFTVPAVAGSNLSNYVTTNIGSMRNRGFELAVNARVLDGGPGGLSWNAGFNASHNSNVLLSINPNASAAQQIQVGGVAGGVGTTIQVLEPGQPINSFFVCQQVYQNGKPVEGKYVSLAGTTVSACDASGLRAYHDPAPHWMLGFTSSLSYRRFAVSFTMRAWLGNWVYNNVASNLGDYRELRQGAPYNLHSSVLQTGFQTQQLLSDYYVEDGSFLRMDNLLAEYQLPYRGQQWRLFVTVQNVFTITGYSGVDPTATLNAGGPSPQFGIDNNIYPRSRTVTSGLSVQF